MTSFLEVLLLNDINLYDSVQFECEEDGEDKKANKDDEFRGVEVLKESPEVQISVVRHLCGFLNLCQIIDLSLIRSVSKFVLRIRVSVLDLKDRTTFLVSTKCHL